MNPNYGSEIFVDPDGKLGLQNQVGIQRVPANEWVRITIEAQIPDFVKVFCNNQLALKVADPDQKLHLDRLLFFGKNNQLDTAFHRSFVMLLDAVKISLAKGRDTPVESRLGTEKDYSSVYW